MGTCELPVLGKSLCSPLFSITVVKHMLKRTGIGEWLFWLTVRGTAAHLGTGVVTEVDWCTVLHRKRRSPSFVLLSLYSVWDWLMVWCPPHQGMPPLLCQSSRNWTELSPPSLPAKLIVKANSLQGKAYVLNGRQRMDHQCKAFLLGKVPAVSGRKCNPQLSIFIQLVLVIDV